MAPFLLFFGALSLTPRWAMFSTLVCLSLPLMLNLQARPAFDFVTFFNGNVASIMGALAATAPSPPS